MALAIIISTDPKDHDAALRGADKFMADNPSAHVPAAFEQVNTPTPVTQPEPSTAQLDAMRSVVSSHSSSNGNGKSKGRGVRPDGRGMIGHKDGCGCPACSSLRAKPKPQTSHAGTPAPEPMSAPQPSGDAQARMNAMLAGLDGAGIDTAQVARPEPEPVQPKRAGDSLPWQNGVDGQVRVTGDVLDWAEDKNGTGLKAPDKQRAVVNYLLGRETRETLEAISMRGGKSTLADSLARKLGANDK